MTMIRKLVRAEIAQLGDDEVEVIMSTDALARDGHVLVPQGCRLDNYLANPIVLWSHDPDKPIGNAEDIVIATDQIRARIRFAPLGISHKADEIRGLMKAGVIRAVSLAFDPLEGEPLDPRKPRGGQRFTDWELLELSPVSVPSDTGALVTARALADGGATEDGDDTMADIDTSATIESPGAPQQRAVQVRTRTGGVTLKRGLYDVAQLCYMFESFGWFVDQAKYEAAIEGDQSQVPAMLGEVLVGLGEALLEMAAEEVAEALAGRDIEIDGAEEAAGDDGLSTEERQHIRAAGSPQVRAFRRGLAQAKLRAGKSLSTDTVRCLREAKDLHDEAMALTRSAMSKHKDGLAAIDGLLDRAGVSDPENEDTQTVQTSGGTGVDEGSQGQRSAADDGAGGFTLRRRQKDLLELTLPEG